MAEKQYKYTTTIKQPQTVVNVELDPKGGTLSERQYKTVKKDAYGASLLEKKLLVIEEVPTSEPAHSGNTGNTGDTGDTGVDAVGEIVPDFETKDTPADRPEDHAGWKPE
jgi:hypothetical protein